MGDVQKAESLVLVMLPPNSMPLEADIDRNIAMVSQMLGLSPDEQDALRKRIHAKVSIRMDSGTALVEEDLPPWLLARKPEIDPFYWARYAQLLRNRSFPPAVVHTLDRVTDDILDLLGDPRRRGQWIRRGLVMGDVQSGKTSTYTALCCKAADAGYRLIVLLTGTLENLRRQTQERLDEGFVGLDSSDLLTKERSIRKGREVGVGVLDKRRAAGVFTSRSRDFSGALVTSLGFRLDAMSEPVLLVLKKNKKILENLTEWLHDFNAGTDDRIDMPILVIDDEADSASVNTRAAGGNPTAINEKIRGLLKLFTRSSYVGFTATPFANIYIDPDTADQMLGHDLFPRHFVYSLEPPSNYMGPAAVFSEEATYSMLRFVDDAEVVIPAKHASTFPVAALPDSLRQAIRSFLIATTIRDLREEGPTHRSMLVNVSRFTRVQDGIATLVEAELKDIQQDVRSYSQLPPYVVLENGNIAALRETWLQEHADDGPDWPEVQQALYKAILPVVVRAVNQRTGAASLDYRAHRDEGLRVIAVGGNSLSRGLTLEGLSTSYFFRNSQMYDTLLQMGRWFGYRDGYADLCRLWLTEEAAHWYAHITLASEELRQELYRMRQEGRTPREFGLKVRAHPDSLIVTAQNKMRNAHTIERLISVSGEGLETPRLRLRADAIRSNARRCESFLRSLATAGIAPVTSPWKNLWWKDVPREHVVSFLRGFLGHSLNFAFQPDVLADYLAATCEPRLQEWDVVIPLPDRSEFEPILLAGHQVVPVRRAVEVNRGQDSILVSGASARVGSRGIEREGLAPEEARKVREAYEQRKPGKNVPDSEYRQVRTRPLLLVYVVKPFVDGNPLDTGGEPLIALGLSFPKFEDSEAERRVKYTVNIVEWQQLFDTETDEEQPEEVV